MKVLLTGAAGFIGSRIAPVLTARGHQVVGLDALIPQAHGPGAQLAADVARVDVRDADAVAALLDGVDVVCHQAAMVGAGVTVGDMPDYASHNDLGTAVLLAAMGSAGVHRVVLASSMVVYGEGRYACPTHGLRTPGVRTPAELDGGVFDHRCDRCGRPLGWEVVPEESVLDPRSSYAASKVAQEHYVRAWVRQAPGAAVALRYHNVYGPGMPRDTPYSGVAAIFRSALAAGRPPRVFEDGGQMRDFVHVDDVALANALAVEAVQERPTESFTAYNIASGTPIPILEVARILGRGCGVEPEVTGEYRLGDVRHVVASPARAADELGFRAAIPPERGIAEFADAPLR